MGRQKNVKNYKGNEVQNFFISAFADNKDWLFMERAWGKTMAQYCALADCSNIKFTFLYLKDVFANERMNLFGY